MSWYTSLDADDCEVLRLAVEGQSGLQISVALGKTHAAVRQQASRLVKRIGANSFQHAVALYANRLGYLGTLMSPGSDTVVELPFTLGVLRYPIFVVSNMVSAINDIDCVITGSQYTPPPDIGALLPQWKAGAIEQARNAIPPRILYSEPNNLFVVTDITATTEFYKRVTINLSFSDYLTYKAVSSFLPVDDELLSRHRVRFPGSPHQPSIPLPLAVILHVILGDPPKLLLALRAPNLGSNPGVYSAVAAGMGEPDKDTDYTRKPRLFDHAGAMVRELGEERFAYGAWKERVTLLGLLYGYRVSPQ